MMCGVALMQPSPVAQELLDTAPERVFDTLTRLASRLLDVPVSLVSILDTHRQFFKSQCGLPEPWATQRETPLTHSFCQYVAQTGAPFIVEDARTDPRVFGNLAVTEIGVIAYLGVPLFDGDGRAYGALCAIHTEPRPWTADDVTTMQALAEQVMSEVALRTRLDARERELLAARALDADRGLAARADRHDLRTPLNAMLLSLEGVRVLGELNEDQLHSLAMAERNGRQVVAMVDQMLDIGNIEARGAAALARGPVASADLIGEAVEQVVALAEQKRHLLQIGCACRRAAIVDREKIVRVLVNLLANAIKFTPAGGTIVVSSAEADDPGPAVRFTVCDTGVGLSPEAIEGVFAEGFRVDPNAPTHRSTGIGLTFCKRVVEAHGGRIGVESQPGKGATFHFVVPAQESPGAA